MGEHDVNACLFHNFTHALPGERSIDGDESGSRFQDAKQRNDLQRKHRLLAESLGAPVACQRLTSADDVRQAYDGPTNGSSPK